MVNHNTNFYHFPGQVCTFSYYIVEQKMYMGDADCSHLAVLCQGGLSVRLAQTWACLIAFRLVWTFDNGQDPAKSVG